MRNHDRHLLQTGQPHEHFFNIPPVVIAIIILCLAVYVIPTYFMTNDGEKTFITFFGFIPALFATDQGLLPRLSAVTYSFLHGSWAHLAFNMVFFVIFGSPLANRLGNFLFLMFWMFTAFIAAMTYFVLHPDCVATLVGASGAISGLMGAAARYGFQRVPDSYAPNRSEFAGPVEPVLVALHSRSVVVFIGGWFVVNLLIGLIGRFATDESGNLIAWEAHIGGLLAGFLAIGFFDRCVSRRD